MGTVRAVPGVRGFHQDRSSPDQFDFTNTAVAIRKDECEAAFDQEEQFGTVVPFQFHDL